jgi:hypothetical protein
MACIGIALRWLFLGVVGALLLTTGAQADCLGFWDLSGSWAITQTNGFIANFELTQTGKDISGTAHCCVRRDPCKTNCQFQPTMDGDVVGHVDGDEFTMTAHWHGTAGGEYKGHITEHGIEGGTTDLNNPGAEGALWYGDHGVTPCTVTTPPSQAESPLEKSGVLKNLPAGTDIFKKTTTPSVPPPPPPPPPFCGNLTRCNILKPSDVFDAPAGNQIDALVLPANTADVCLLEVPQQNNTWFHVKWPARQEGGWAFSGPGYENAITCP